MVSFTVCTCNVIKQNQLEVKIVASNIKIPYSQIKDIISFVSYCFCNPSIVNIFGTKCPILMRVSAKCSIANNAFIIKYQFKLNAILYFILILLGRITCRTHHFRKGPTIFNISHTAGHVPRLSVKFVFFMNFKYSSCIPWWSV